MQFCFLCKFFVTLRLGPSSLDRTLWQLLRGFTLLSTFHSIPFYRRGSSLQVEDLSVCLSSLQDFEYRPITSSQDHARPHIIYCWAEGDVSCHLAMSMTHTKTNTNTNTHTKTNTKCFKDPMYVIFLKSMGFKDFKYDMDMDM